MLFATVNDMKNTKCTLFTNENESTQLFQSKGCWADTNDIMCRLQICTPWYFLGLIKCNTKPQWIKKASCVKHRFIPPDNRSSWVDFKPMTVILMEILTDEPVLCANGSWKQGSIKCTHQETGGIHETGFLFCRELKYIRSIFADDHDLT